MRPLRLEIEGLTSFREQQVIEFDGFELFVITGPTGAGKTTILDAMTLALYGVVPRMGKQNTSDLVTHGTTRAKVQLDFRAGGKTYRIARVLPRKGAQSAALHRFDGDVWRTEVDESGVRPVNARIEAIVGLNFEAFTRAVLLPQGEFARFLTGDVSKRREILMRLLDLERYQIAGELARKEAERLNMEVGATARLIETEYADATEAAVAAAAEAADRSRGHAAAMATTAEAAERIVGRLLELDTQLASVQRDASTLTGVVVALEQVETASNELAPRKAEADAAVLDAEAAVARARSVHREAVAALDTVRARTGDERQLAELESACKAIAEAAGEEARLSADIAAAERDVGERSHDFSDAAEALENARVRHTAALTVESRGWHAELQARQQASDKLAMASDAAEARLKHLTTEHTAIGLRTGLAAGDPCPVCRHPVETLPESPPDIVSAIAGAEREARVAREQAGKAERTVSDAVSEANVADRSLTEALEALNGLGGAPLLARVEAAAARLPTKLADAAKERNAAARAERQATEEEQNARLRLAKATTDRDGHLRQRRATEARRRTAEARLRAGFPDGVPDDPSAEIARRRSVLERVGDDERVAQRRLNAAREAVEAAGRKQRDMEREAAQLIQRCVEQRVTLLTLAATRGIKFTAAVKKARAEVGDEVSALRDLCMKVFQELEGLETDAGTERTGKTTELGGKLTAMRLNPGTGSPAEILPIVRNAVLEAETDATRKADEANRLQEKFVRRGEMEAGVSEARKRERLYRELAGELRQNRFIDFLLGESLERLAELASTELRGISDGRYSLIGRDTGFVVVDHANADETRSVDTLSGGETFLASLSLATALARSITDIAGEAIGARLEAMFIDEGFGALDADSLEAAVDALERFRDSGRLVGVITHVNGVAERIPDGLVVERKGGSSHVRLR